MKKIILQVVFAAVLALGGSTIGYGQLSQTYSAHIPFDFTVGKTELKAGDYRVKPVLGATGNGFLLLIGLDNDKTRMLGLVGQGDYRWDDKAANQMIFVEDNGRYALANIETNTFHKSIPGVTASARIMTKNTGGSTTVSVALD